MKNRELSRSWFTPEEFKNLEYNFLDTNSYASFIKEIHKETCQTHVIENKNGFKLPEDLGYLGVKKLYRPEGIYNKRTKTLMRNEHTFGYVYKFTHIKKPGSKWYAGYFNKFFSTIKRIKVEFDLFKLNPHKTFLKKEMSDRAQYNADSLYIFDE